MGRVDHDRRLRYLGFSGYVPQEDIIYENLTLKKMLYYTAKLKMPPDTSRHR